MAVARQTIKDRRMTKRPRRGKAVAALRRLRPRATLVEQVVERVRDGVFRGEFPPGSELPAEGTLARTMGVSYTVIREAMRTLRTYGLVEISQGRRPRIKPVGPDAVRQTLDAMLRRAQSSIRELTELRRPLECEIAALAAGRATPAETQQMADAVERQARAATLDEQIEIDIQFHVLLARAAGNVLFELVMSSVWDLLWESRRRTISQVGVAHALTGHREVLDAVRHHDVEAARQAMRRHIEMIVEDVGEPDNAID
jgi:GntR family transcriptional regulator, transcriptional repressor for pyruvate dehydrogenase complex